MEFEAVIGLEVHAQLLTESKMFCSCSTKFGDPPNTHICPICTGLPGVLPSLNKKALEFAIKAALATNCRISQRSIFARKNYFYPDLPKGYQISQYEEPLAQDGYLEIDTDFGTKKIGIIRIHMEEDAGKLIHDERGLPISYVDFNRAGVPLIEIVSKPDIRSPKEAIEYLKELRDILVYLDICDGNMEEGSFRCDANISVRPKGDNRLGTKVELKNMNSFKHLESALSFEIERQTSILEEGGRIYQETRLFDVKKGITVSMRRKEEAHDYRYFPDPDLLPVVVEESWIEDIRKTLPELPRERRKRFIKQYGLPLYDAKVLTQTKTLANYFEEVLETFSKPKVCSNFIMSEFLREINRERIDPKDAPVRPCDLGLLLRFVDEGKISGKMAKDIFEKMWKEKKSPKEIIEKEGISQITDKDSIRELVKKVLAENPNEVSAYKGGKKKILGYFVGQVMKLSKGRANPKLVNEILLEELSD